MINSPTIVATKVEATKRTVGSNTNWYSFVKLKYSGAGKCVTKDATKQNITSLTAPIQMNNLEYERYKNFILKHTLYKSK